MSKLKVNIENIARLAVPATPTVTECQVAAQLAHAVASDQTLNVETRGTFSALADELGRTPEKVPAADPRSARLLGEVVALANQVLPTTT